MLGKCSKCVYLDKFNKLINESDPQEYKYKCHRNESTPYFIEEDYDLEFCRCDYFDKDKKVEQFKLF